MVDGCCVSWLDDSVACELQQQLLGACVAEFYGGFLVVACAFESCDGACAEALVLYDGAFAQEETLPLPLPCREGRCYTGIP